MMLIALQDCGLILMEIHLGDIMKDTKEKIFMKNKPKPFLKPAMDKTMRKMLRGYVKVIKDLPRCVIIPVWRDPKIIDMTLKQTPLCDLIPRFRPGKKIKKESTIDKFKRLIKWGLYLE